MAVAVANSVAPAIDELLGDDACAPLARLRRWWDIDPENPMGLTGATHGQLQTLRGPRCVG